MFHVGHRLSCSQCNGVKGSKAELAKRQQMLRGLGAKTTRKCRPFVRRLHLVSTMSMKAFHWGWHVKSRQTKQGGWPARLPVAVQWRFVCPRYLACAVRILRGYNERKLTSWQVSDKNILPVWNNWAPPSTEWSPWKGRDNDVLRTWKRLYSLEEKKRPNKHMVG